MGNVCVCMCYRQFNDAVEPHSCGNIVVKLTDE